MTPPSSTCVSTSTLYPNLIVPVATALPQKSFGTQDTAVVNRDISLLLQFDVPANGLKTCRLEILTPGTGANPGSGTASYSIGGPGTFDVATLTGSITKDATFASASSLIGSKVGSFVAREGGSSHIVTLPCVQFATQGFYVTSVNRSSLTIFEDFNPPATGYVLIQSC